MRTAAIIGLLVAALRAPPAAGGNLDSYFIGNTAAMMAGAITAATRDAEALWYNPAGLALAGVDGRPRTSLEVSGTAFALRYRPLAGTIVTDLNLDPAASTDPTLITERSPVDFSFDTVGTSLLFCKQLTPTLGLGFGLVVPVKDRFRTTDSFTREFEVEGFPSAVEYEQRTEIDLTRAEYHAGIAVGWQPVDGLRIGLSFFAFYADISGRGTFWSHLWTPDDPTFADITLLAELTDSLGIVGGHLAAGLQWDIGRGVTLGFQVRTPSFVFATFPSGTELAAFSQTVPSSGIDATSTSNFDEVDRGDAGLDVLRGTRMAIGLSWAFPGGVLAIDGDVQLGSDNDLGTETELTWNIRVGARGFVSESWVLGGGLFTDRSGNRSAAALGELDVDFYGAAFGVEWRKQYGLSDAPSDTLLLVTTIGLRYSMGVGDAGSFVYSPFADDVTTPIVVERGAEVRFHEMAVHIGSGVYF
ncbi:MAG: hypothetical protein IV100_15090 [Myxococcales bacterium]|nr:hypothetical protein [Myxococcales bacterium]